MMAAVEGVSAQVLTVTVVKCCQARTELVTMSRTMKHKRKMRDSHTHQVKHRSEKARNAKSF